MAMKRQRTNQNKIVTVTEYTLLTKSWSSKSLRGLNPIRSTLPISSAFLWSESDGVTGQKFEVQVATTCT